MTRPFPKTPEGWSEFAIADTYNDEDWAIVKGDMLVWRTTEDGMYHASLGSCRSFDTDSLELALRLVELWCEDVEREADL